MAIQLVFLGFHHVIEYKLSSTHLAGLGTATMIRLHIILKSLGIFLFSHQRVSSVALLYTKIGKYWDKRKEGKGHRLKRIKSFGTAGNVAIRHLPIPCSTTSPQSSYHMVLVLG